VDIKFVPINLADIHDILAYHLSSLSRPVETFFESHVEKSNHYYIYINGIEAGYTSIHESSMVTQFCLQDAFKRYGQSVFQRIKKMERVQRAFVPTCDEFFLSYALDEYRDIKKQAYVFQYHDDEDQRVDDAMFFTRQAETGDMELIRQMSGDFFEPIEERIRRGELFSTYKNDECAGIGIIEPSKFCSDYAAIGMFTAESFRNMGVGTATLRYLIQACKRNQRQPVAGCGYYNHFSKRTLEKAGMYSQTRLLKIDY